MEFVGSFKKADYEILLKSPEDLAINRAVAWVGSGTMGIVLTNKEYEDGYTKREGFQCNRFAVAYCNSFIIN